MSILNEKTTDLFKNALQNLFFLWCGMVMMGALAVGHFHFNFTGETLFWNFSISMVVWVGGVFLCALLFPHFLKQFRKEEGGMHFSDWIFLFMIFGGWSFFAWRAYIVYEDSGVLIAVYRLLLPLTIL